MLWFTFKFVSLNHWKQQNWFNSPIYICCDLLSNLYLWTIGNNIPADTAEPIPVVIYFQICIFEPLETTDPCAQPAWSRLWFTFKFVSLNHWKQPAGEEEIPVLRCDLLSNLYLWTIGNNSCPFIILTQTVVIYFQICIFEPLETTNPL